MAALQGQYSLAPVALAAGIPKTVLRIKAGTSRKVRLLQYGFFFDGTDVLVSPVVIQIGRISADGSFGDNTGLIQGTVIGGGGGAIEPLDDDLTEPFEAQIGADATTEPTYAGFLRTIGVHPKFSNESLLQQQCPIEIRPGGMLGFLVTAGAAVNVRGFVTISE